MINKQFGLGMLLVSLIVCCSVVTGAWRTAKDSKGIAAGNCTPCTNQFERTIPEYITASGECSRCAREQRQSTVSMNNYATCKFMALDDQSEKPISRHYSEVCVVDGYCSRGHKISAVMRTTGREGVIE